MTAAPTCPPAHADDATLGTDPASPGPADRAHARRSGRLPALAATLLTLASLGLVAVGAVAGAPAASAHDALKSSTPASGSRVATTPDSLVLHFEEPPATIGLAVVVTGPTGDVQDGAPRIEGKDVVQALLPSAPAGAYRVAWRVTADDGHPVSGELAFTSAAANPREVTATPLVPGAGTPTPTSGSGATSGATTSASTPAPVADATSASSGTGPVATVVVVVVVLLGAAALVLARRRRT